MSQINPFTWVAQQGQVQQKLSVSREREVRRAQNLARNAALSGDRLEHQVESSDAIRQAEDHDPNLPDRRNRKRREADEEKPKLDIRA